MRPTSILKATQGGVRIEAIDHRVRSNAERIHAVQFAAHTQEAALLGAARFPPLERTIEDVQAAQERYVVALRGLHLVGAISAGPDEEADATQIASLAVAPASQRRGIAALLMAAVRRSNRSGCGDAAPASAEPERRVSR